MKPVAMVLSVLFFLALPLGGQTIFPSPVHLTRQIADPIANSVQVIEEYAYGNRLISVSGSRTTIADYEKGELIEIDREAATYSVTPFSVIAKSASQFGPSVSTAEVRGDRQPRIRVMGTDEVANGRAAERVEIRIGEGDFGQQIDLVLDREASLTKEGLEVLLGAAYPGVRRPEHEAIIEAASAGAAATGAQSRVRGWKLPLEQVTTISVDDSEIEFRATVVRVGDEAPPSELTAIPAGARLVESRLSAVNRVLEDADKLVAPPRP